MHYVLVVFATVLYFGGLKTVLPVFVYHVTGKKPFRFQTESSRLLKPVSYTVHNMFMVLVSPFKEREDG